MPCALHCAMACAADAAPPAYRLAKDAFLPPAASAVQHSPGPHNRQPIICCLIQQSTDHGRPGHAGGQHAASQLGCSRRCLHHLPPEAAGELKGVRQHGRRQKAGCRSVAGRQRQRQQERKAGRHPMAVTQCKLPAPSSWCVQSSPALLPRPLTRSSLILGTCGSPARNRRPRFPQTSLSEQDLGSARRRLPARRCRHSWTPGAAAAR